LKLGFAGTPEFSVPALERLAALGELRAVFTQPDRPAGRGKAVKASAVKRRALELGLTVLQPPSFKTDEAQASLAALSLDVLVVVAYGLILPPAVLKLPKAGCINIHASLLPRWRGAAPIQRALLAGDAESGVTLMRMEAGLDTGPMLARASTPIAPGETAGTLHDRLSVLGADLLAAHLSAIVSGALPETNQPAEGVTYAAKINKAEARLDWRKSALTLAREVRAFNPIPVTDTLLKGEQLRVFAAEATGGAGDPGTVLVVDTGIVVACGEGALRLTQLQLAGRKPLAARDFVKGHPLDGARLGV
jgi:methionyl-tRNA formyltransferase